MKRLVLTTLAGLTAFALVTGLAASMSVSADTLGSGTAVVASCQPASAGAINVSFGVTAGSVDDVSEVTLSNVDGACNGLDYALELVGSTLGVVTGVLSVDASGNAVIDLTTGGTAKAADVTSVNLTISG